MRLLIVSLVIALHIFVVLLLYHPAETSRRRTDPDREGATQSETQGAEAPPEAAAGAHRGRLQFDSNAFPELGQALPRELRRKVQACKTGILLDWTNRKTLWRKNDATVVAIASLSKMMTALLLMEAVDAEPNLSLATRVKVSASAAKVGGSQVYLDPKETFTLEELLKCVMIFSACDAAELVAEHLGGGDAAAFVAQMNARAREMRMKDLHFVNAHGLPTADRKSENRGTAAEMAFLAGTLLDYPDVVRWSSTWLSYIREDTSHAFQLVNRNRLVNPTEGVEGVNGMKTGYTNKAGYCLAATCQREGRVLIAVVTGCASSGGRNALVEELLAWGYSLAPG